MPKVQMFSFKSVNLNYDKELENTQVLQVTCAKNDLHLASGRC